MIDRKNFFDVVRADIYHGTLKQSQVDGMNIILDEWERREYSDKRWLAYMLATTWWETGQTFQPIRERGSGDGPDPDPYDDYLEYLDTRTDLGQTAAKDGDHVPYVGKGYVQLTGKNNYKRVGELLDIDLYDHPDLALQPRIAAEILIVGMVEGIFTGKSLGKYFNETAEDWVNARKIVNALDHAQDIAGVAQIFNRAIKVVPDQKTEPKPPTVNDAVVGTAIGTGIVAVATGLAIDSHTVFIIGAVIAVAVAGILIIKKMKKRK